MALNSSGQISMNEIRVELGIPTQSPFSLDAAENGSYVLLNQCSTNRPSPNNPASISEWYGYCHNCSCGTVDCDTSQNQGSGGTGFYNYTINLGSSVGIVRFTYYAYSIPDKFVVTYNGTDVIDTGFRGDSSYNAALNALGYPNVSGSGNGYIDFTKTTSSPTTANVQVIAPLGNTAWDFTLGCPYYSYSLSYSATSCAEACNSGVVTTYYSTCSPLTSFCLLKTQPVGGLESPALSGAYSDGVNCIVVSDGALPGQIISVSACPTPTATPTPSPTPTPTTTPTPSPTPTTTPTPSPTPSPTPTPTPTDALTDVNITICGPNNADGSGFVTLYAYSDVGGTPTNVDTNVDVPVRWVGDLSSVLTGTITINNGSNCGSITVGGANSGENVSLFTFNGSITPSQSGTQQYNQSTTSTSNSCITC